MADGNSKTLERNALGSSKHLIQTAASANTFNIGSTYDPFEDQFVCFQHQRVLSKSSESTYEKWVQGETKRLAADRDSGYISIMTLACGNREFLLVFRFTDYRSLMHWLRSDKRAEWVKEGAAICTELSHDIAQGGCTLLPETLNGAVKSMFDKRTKASGLSLAPTKTRSSGAGAGAGRRNKCPQLPATPCGNHPTCCGTPYMPVGPPPAWRNVIVIWCAATSVFLPYALYVAKHLYGVFLPDVYGGMWKSDPGMPCEVVVPTAGQSGANLTISFDVPCGKPITKHMAPFWAFVITVLGVNALIVWCVIPIWNFLCRPFTHGFKRFDQCGLNCEPFICLDDGLPCFRPHPAMWESAVQANEKGLQASNRRLAKMVRAQASIRHRVLARLEALEAGRGSGLATGNNKSNRAGQLTQAARHRVDSEAAAAVNVRVDGEVAQLKDVGSLGEASVYIRTYVERGKQFQAEEHCHDIARAMYKDFPGLLGMIIIQNTNNTFKNDELLEYDLYFEFDTVGHLKAWMGSQTRRDLLVLGHQIFLNPVENATNVQVAVHTSISSLFVQPANLYANAIVPSANGNAGAEKPFEFHPQTWKMYLALNVGFGVVGYPLGDLWLLDQTGFSPIGHLDPRLIVMIANAIIVPMVVYVSMPMVIYFSAHWLFAPWRKSDNFLIAIAQEGFPCCLADGPPPPPPPPAGDEAPMLEMKDRS